MFAISVLIGASVCAQSGDAYRVGSGDVLRLTILGKHDYRLVETPEINEAGKIFVSIMNESVDVKGLTTEEIDEKVTAMLAKDYLVNPEVMVEVGVYRSHTVLVIGDVKHPGEIVLQEESLGLKDLLIKTGGPVGDMDKTVMVISANPGENREPVVSQLDQILMGNAAVSVQVKKDDIVYVLSRDKTLPLQDMENVIYVFGQVSKPGLIPYSKGLTTLRAVLNAGNFSKEAAPGRTFIKRHEGEKIKTIRVDLNDVMSGGDKDADIPLQPGDVVYVPRAIF